MSATCLFCKIIKGTIPSIKVYETPMTYAFMDIMPLSKGHVLVIPKHHGQKLHEIPDESLADLLPVVKKIAKATGGDNYNVLQNNGRLAHQAVDHVHFHVIPKTQESGLCMEWESLDIKDQLEGIAKDIMTKL